MRVRVLVAVIACVMMVSCHQRASDVPGGEPASGSGLPTIAVIPKGTAHVFWQTVHAGAIAAATEYGAKVAWRGPESETDIAKQRAIVEDYLNAGVDAIVLAPCDENALVPVIESATAAGKPVVIFDSSAKTELYVSFVATDNYAGGVKAAEMMGKVLDGKGKVAIVGVQPGGASTTKRENGFMDTIKKKFPDIELLPIKYGMSDRARSMAVAEDMLTATPDLDAFFGPNESSTFGALLALQKQKREKKVKLVGFDSSPELLKALREGEIEALVVQNPFMIGYQGVQTAVQALYGETPDRRIDTGVHVVTRDNMDTPEIKAILEPEIDKYLKK